VATLFGCVIGLQTSVTGITLVALGTSLPDTFASRSAAIQERDADAAIGNITGQPTNTFYKPLIELLL
jgi:solute carrier family 8 (sodium/calcium exchanger)